MEKEGRQLKGTAQGLLLSAFLMDHFSTYIDTHFTSDMESQLDYVSGCCPLLLHMLDCVWGCGGLSCYRSTSVVVARQDVPVKTCMRHNLRRSACDMNTATLAMNSITLHHFSQGGGGFLAMGVRGLAVADHFMLFAL